MLTAGKWKIDLASPHQVYKNAAGKRLPGVTTILGVFDKPALKRWGLGMERDNLLDIVRDEFKSAKFMVPAIESKAFPLDGTAVSGDTLVGEFVKGVLRRCPENTPKGEPTYFCERFTERAADIGTVTHARCEAFLHGVELDEEGLDAELVDKSMNGFIRFHDWWCERKLAVVHSELQMVSETMQVGGTADIIARNPDGTLTLVDLKTSKGSKWWPYPETFGQVAVYAAMYEEFVHDPIRDVHICRIGKEENDPGQTYTLNAAERAAGMRLFRAGLEAYNARKELSRV